VGVGGEKLEAEPPADNSIYNDLGLEFMGVGEKEVADEQ